MLPQAKTKFKECISILNEINELKHNDIFYSKEKYIFQLNRVKIEAEKIKDNNPADAFALLGIIACLEDNIEEMHINHKKALSYEDSPEHKEDYAISLLHSHLFDEAYKYFLDLYTKADKNDLLILEGLIKYTAILNLNEEYDKYINQFKMLTGKEYDLKIFREDNEKILSNMIRAMDYHIDNNPDMIEEFDPDLFALAEELVEGVEI